MRCRRLRMGPRLIRTKSGPNTTRRRSSSPDSGIRMRGYVCKRPPRGPAQYRRWWLLWRPMKKPEIVLATHEHFAELGEAVRRGGRAIAAVLDGKTVGVAGYYLEKGDVIVYSTITTALRPHKRTIIQGAMIIVGMVDEIGAPARALAGDIAGAERLLERIGFERVVGATYWRTPWRRQVH